MVFCLRFMVHGELSSCSSIIFFFENIFILNFYFAYIYPNIME